MTCRKLWYVLMQLRRCLWERLHSDFISDIVYNRYGVGAAYRSASSRYFQTSPGLLIGYDSDGNVIWERSLMEEFARLTFPNGRTEVHKSYLDLVISRNYCNWGKQGQPEIMVIFDKKTGDLGLLLGNHSKR